TFPVDGTPATFRDRDPGRSLGDASFASLAGKRARAAQRRATSARDPESRALSGRAFGIGIVALALRTDSERDSASLPRAPPDQRCNGTQLPRSRARQERGQREPRRGDRRGVATDDTEAHAKARFRPRALISIPSRLAASGRTP